MQLLAEQLNGALVTRDTPRGLVAVVPGSGFSGPLLRPGSSEQVGRIAAILAAHPWLRNGGLRVEVEGNSDADDAAALSQQRAEAVREGLVGRGLASNVVSARGMGNSRPLAPNTTAAGREQNQRVEIVIVGDAIGNTPFWDRSYSLTSSQIGNSWGIACILGKRRLLDVSNGTALG